MTYFGTVILFPVLLNTSQKENSHNSLHGEPPVETCPVSYHNWSFFMRKGPWWLPMAFYHYRERGLRDGSRRREPLFVMRPPPPDQIREPFDRLS